MKRLYVFLLKTFLCIILFLVVAILCKRDIRLKTFVKEHIYEESMSFSNLKNFYNHYLGGVFPIEIISSNTREVFNEKLYYDGISRYEDGAVLNVGSGYLVPSLKEGIVVYVGEKDKYRQVVIVEGGDGVHIWYGNLCNINVVLYDTISSGTYLGEVCDKELYLVFSKGNDFLDYADYLE